MIEELYWWRTFVGIEAITAAATRVAMEMAFLWRMYASQTTPLFLRMREGEQSGKGCTNSAAFLSLETMASGLTGNATAAKDKLTCAAEAS